MLNQRQKAFFVCVFLRQKFDLIEFGLDLNISLGSKIMLIPRPDSKQIRKIEDSYFRLRDDQPRWRRQCQLCNKQTIPDQDTNSQRETFVNMAIQREISLPPPLPSRTFAQKMRKLLNFAFEKMLDSSCLLQQSNYLAMKKLFVTHDLVRIFWFYCVLKC